MVRIITDTSSDLTVDEANALGIILLPMTINFGNESFLDRYELSTSMFYDKLTTSNELPTTCQVNPFQFEEEIDKAKEANDDIVIITLSSKLSGTYQSAVIACNEYDKAYAIDSLTVAMSQQCLVRYAVMLRENGLDGKTIADKLTDGVGKVKVIGLLDTLEYLKKGGRISPTTAWAGALLNIKPVVTTDDGLVGILGKARGSKNGNNMLNELITKWGGADTTLPIVLGYSGNDRKLLDQYMNDCKALVDIDIEKIPVSQIGSTIGTHVGPGAIAVGFFINQ